MNESQLLKLEGFAEKSALNLLSSIENSKQTTFSKLLYSLGIPQIGETTAELLANRFGEMNELIRADVEMLESISDIGPIVANGLLNFFADQNNVEIVNGLISVGVTYPIRVHSEEQNLKLPLSGHIVVITGTLSSVSRDDAKKKLQDKGAKVTSSVSKNTTMVLVGEDPGSKAKKASDLGIKIITEDDFNVLAGD